MENDTSMMIVPGSSTYIPKYSFIKACISARLVQNRTISFPSSEDSDFYMNNSLFLNVDIDTYYIDNTENPEPSTDKENEGTTRYCAKQSSNIFNRCLSSSLSELVLSDFSGYSKDEDSEEANAEVLKSINTRIKYFKKHLKMLNTREEIITKIQSEREEDESEESENSSTLSKLNNALLEVNTALEEDGDKHRKRMKFLEEKFAVEKTLLDTDNVMLMINYLENSSDIKQLDIRHEEIEDICDALKQVVVNLYNYLNDQQTLRYIFQGFMPPISNNSTPNGNKEYFTSTEPTTILEETA